MKPQLYYWANSPLTGAFLLSVVFCFLLCYQSDHTGLLSGIEFGTWISIFFPPNFILYSLPLCDEGLTYLCRSLIILACRRHCNWCSSCVRVCSWVVVWGCEIHFVELRSGVGIMTSCVQHLSKCVIDLILGYVCLSLNGRVKIRFLFLQ